MGPLLDAVENMCGYYITRGVDIFKEAVSGSLICTTINMECVIKLFGNTNNLEIRKLENIIFSAGSIAKVGL